MPTQVPWSERNPDYGIPYRLIQRNSWAERLISYAAFVVRVKPPGCFTYQTYCDFRIGNQPSRDKFRAAAKKLVGLGYLLETPDGYYITTKGLDASLRISRRNAKSRHYTRDDD